VGPRVLGGLLPDQRRRSPARHRTHDGRYPGDVCDGDNDQPGIDHPWAVCTCNFAELYYRLANEIMAGNTIPLDANSAEFFNQVGVTASSTPVAAATEQ
jgi:glucoamylase